MSSFANTVTAVKAALPSVEAGLLSDLEGVLAKSTSPGAALLNDALPVLLTVANHASGEAIFQSFFTQLSAKIPFLAEL